MTAMVRDSAGVVQAEPSSRGIAVVGRLNTDRRWQPVVSAWQNLLSAAPPTSLPALPPMLVGTADDSSWSSEEWRNLAIRRRQLSQRQTALVRNGEVREVWFAFSQQARNLEGISRDGLVHARCTLPPDAPLEFVRAADAGQSDEAGTLLRECRWWELPRRESSQRVEISRDDCHSLLCLMQRHHPRTGPRALRFDLAPGQPPQLTVEPRSQPLPSAGRTCDIPAARTIRVWNARRLLRLAGVLPLVDRIDVELTATAAPHFWTLHLGPAQLSVAIFGADLSDWTRVAWQLPDTGTAAEREAVRSRERLRSLADWLRREIQAARGLAAAQRAIITRLAPRDDGRRVVLGIVDRQPVELWLDDDGLVSRARCRCAGYRRRGSLLAPCRHLRALHLAATSPAMAVP